ncbi:glycosyl hydrolase catalytic core-domain-containing protein [Bipolaris maydis]|nr:glycoside hydrolase family 128 protein [Bipolaris maydis]KAJ6192503.1 glycosyl hydrolase catalytic core-domain-containing protein [Bipolaris maydis]
MPRLHPSRQHKQQMRLTTTALSILATTALAQQSKRGFAFIGDTHKSDNQLLTSESSQLSWYYNWSPYPNSDLIPANRLEFVPMIHGIDATKDQQTERVIRGLPESSKHLLSFNEPDGSESSGGSSISPEDAAKAYIDYVVPFRKGDSGGRKWLISHPSTTGSPNGLDWLRQFNESCYDIDSTNGCPADFVAVHWYGAFDGLASWLGTLDEFYNKNTSRSVPLELWITEMALPQQDADNTVEMMNQTLPYLDGEENVARYAWFGAFRPDDANEWTGDGVALFDDDGGLTKLGALYMGDGFKEGQKGKGAEEDAGSGLRVSVGMMAALAACATVFSML